MLLIQYITGIVSFFAIIVLVWLVTERYDIVPSFLQYRPFNCKKCLGFWTGVAVSVGMFLLGWWVAGLTLLILSVANACAVILDERNGIQL